MIQAIPSWYRPYLHLAVPSFFGLGIMAVSLMFLSDLVAWELLVIPLTYIFSNLVEWFTHRNMMHRRTPQAAILYDRHVPQHHRVYVTEDMAMREPIEFRLVLIPAYGILLIFLATLPLTTAFYFLIGKNVAALFVFTTMGYVVGYEWLHLSYHLPATHPVSKNGLIKKLRTHHAVHHDPRLMQQWNLNVTVPLWDWILGTNYKK